MRRAGKLILILLAFLLSASNSAAVDITFRPEAAIDDAEIRLGDIADFSDNSVVAVALSSLVLGPAPEPGEALLLNSERVRQYLVSSQPIPPQTVLQGASAVAVKRNGQPISPQFVLDLISDYLKDNKDNLPDADIRFVPDSLPLPFFIPVGEITTEIIPSNPNILGSSRFSIIFRIGPTVAKNMSIRGNIEAIGQIVVSAKRLKRGQILEQEDLTIAATDISDLQQPGFSIDEFVGQKLTRTLRAGTPVVSTMVETLPVVHRGERVKILVKSGALQVTATGLAHSDGKLDQMIRVQNISSNKILFCRVAAPGLVEVVL